ncbi:phage-related protein [Klebsiella oxytoca]|uniref:Phage-related protein n=1 Tax=Klebsiella oxytoca TaxID=571 RepID=A0A318FSR9_KLEOX|nr:phage tail protein [Klebsiella oxytoca]PXW46366.1 phage-related protein [Klebsiella oxytoca]
MAIETFTWRTQIQAGLQGDFNFNVREASFGDGYQQIVGDGIHSEKQTWPVTLTGEKEEILAVLEFMRRHVTKSFIWDSPTGESGLYRVSPDSLKLSPLSNQVMTVTATFNQAYAP